MPGVPPPLGRHAADSHAAPLTTEGSASSLQDKPKNSLGSGDGLRLSLVCLRHLLLGAAVEHNGNHCSYEDCRADGWNRYWQLLICALWKSEVETFRGSLGPAAAPSPVMANSKITEPPAIRSELRGMTEPPL